MLLWYEMLLPRIFWTCQCSKSRCCVELKLLHMLLFGLRSCVSATDSSYNELMSDLLSLLIWCQCWIGLLLPLASWICWVVCWVGCCSLLTASSIVDLLLFCSALQNSAYFLVCSTMHWDGCCSLLTRGLPTCALSCAAMLWLSCGELNHATGCCSYIHGLLLCSWGCCCVSLPNWFCWFLSFIRFIEFSLHCIALDYCWPFYVGLF